MLRIAALASSAPLKLPPRPYIRPRVSPDGSRLAVGQDDLKEADVWVYDFAGSSAMRRLTFGGRNRFPVWSADSRRVTYQSERDGSRSIFWQSADGGPEERLTTADKGDAHVPESWSPDGKHLLFSVVKGSSFSLWVLRVEDKKAAPFGDVRGSNEAAPCSRRTGGGWPTPSMTSAPIRVHRTGACTSSRFQPRERDTSSRSASLIIIRRGCQAVRSSCTSRRRAAPRLRFPCGHSRRSHSEPLWSCRRFRGRDSSLLT